MRRLSPTVVTALLVTLEIGVLLVLERRAPARAARESPRTRLFRNGVLGGLALAATGSLETPVVACVAGYGVRRGWGLLPRTGLPPPVRAAVALAALDYGIYVWHVALHRVPALWRLHLVHHVDRDCDVTTALRIHALEIALSLAVRIAQVTALGVTPAEYALWQRLFGASVIFHHANVRLPRALDRALGRVVMTPRRHGIHHLAERAARHGSWSSGLVLWDRLHGTLHEGDAENEVGVPAYRDDADVTLARMLILPFGVQRDPWRAR
ncbi:MAG: hypothetical protein NVS2B3_12640 [Vulcanimicrobiaceae bacterium]